MDGALHRKWIRRSMSEDRTEKATPKRREEARKRGQVARSQEVNTGMSLLGAFVLLGVFGAATYQSLSNLMVRTFTGAGEQRTMTPNAAWGLGVDLITQCIRLVTPFAAGAVVLGITASVIQVKPMLSTESMKPKFSVLNPGKGLKRLVSIRSLVNLVKDLLKLTIVGAVTWMVLRSSFDDLVHMTGAEPRTSVAMVGGLVLKLGLFVGGAYMLLAVADVIYQRWQHEKDLRMTKDEVKREMKEGDLSPEVKGQMKRRQREMAMARMMSAVPDADVVITNPTHFAVALRYARDLPAPQVVAKGADRQAFRIRTAANEHGIQIVEDPPLARSLYAAAEVGEFIPAEAFAAVAEILAMVYRAGHRAPAETAAVAR